MHTGRCATYVCGIQAGWLGLEEGGVGSCNVTKKRHAFTQVLTVIPCKNKNKNSSMKDVNGMRVRKRGV